MISTRYSIVFYSFYVTKIVYILNSLRVIQNNIQTTVIILIKIKIKHYVKLFLIKKIILFITGQTSINIPISTTIIVSKVYKKCFFFNIRVNKLKKTMHYANGLCV